MKPIGVQLYSLREESKDDFGAVLERLAAMGYKGVEPFNLFGMSTSAFRKRVEDLGMVVCSSHTPWANRSEIGEVIEVVSELGLSRAAGGFGPDDFKDLDAVKQTADTANALVEQLKPAGLELFLHNHWWEIQELEGEPAYYHFERLCPEVKYEIDTYWAANFGARDPAEEVRHFKSRSPLLHIKDGPLEEKKAHVAVGQGKVDIASVVRAGDEDVLEWLIVELDACDTDMFEAVEASHRYLTENGLAEGR